MVLFREQKGLIMNRQYLLTINCDGSSVPVLIFESLDELLAWVKKNPLKAGKRTPSAIDNVIGALSSSEAKRFYYGVWAFTNGYPISVDVAEHLLTEEKVQL